MVIRRSLITLVSALTLAALTVPASAQDLSNPAALREQAPPVYKAKFDTTKGVFVLEVRRDWAPNGADRFYNLVKNGFYDNVRFFRVAERQLGTCLQQFRKLITTVRAPVLRDHDPGRCLQAEPLEQTTHREQPSPGGADHDQLVAHRQRTLR